MPTVSGLCRVIGQIARFFFCKRRIARLRARGVCRASLQVSLPSAEVPHPHAQPSEWISLDPEGQNESVFISPVIESSTSTSPSGGLWFLVQTADGISHLGYRAPGRSTPTSPPPPKCSTDSLCFAVRAEEEKKIKGCTDAGWLAGWLALLSADPNFYDSLFIECEITVPVAAAQVGRKWSRAVFFFFLAYGIQLHAAAHTLSQCIMLHATLIYLFINLFFAPGWRAT